MRHARPLGTITRGAGNDRVLPLDEPVALDIAAAVRVKHVRGLEARLADELEGDLGEDRLLVGQVDPERLQGPRRVRVHGLGDQQAVGGELRAREREQLLDLLEREVLDHLRAEDDAEAAILDRSKVRDPVRLEYLRVPLLAAPGDHPGVGVDADAVDP